MNDPEQTAHYHTPSRKSILLSTAIAFIVAAIILITIVLPVEYNLDPTGLGNMLGLTVISDSNTETYVVREPWEGPQVTPGSEKFAQSVNTPFRSETIDIPVQGDEELEYKFQMREGQMLLYSWSSGSTELYFEFHAEPTEGEYPEGYYMSYKIGDGSTGGHGTLVAPFTGNHGWYFLNLTGHPVTVKLKVSGYYDSHGRLW